MLAKRSRVMQVSCLTSHFDRRRLDVFETGVVDLDTLIFRRGVRVLTKATRHEKKKCKLRSSKSTTLKTLILSFFVRKENKFEFGQITFLPLRKRVQGPTRTVHVNTWCTHALHTLSHSPSLTLSHSCRRLRERLYGGPESRDCRGG